MGRSVNIADINFRSYKLRKFDMRKHELHGVACGPRYPFILREALATMAGIHYYR